MTAVEISGVTKTFDGLRAVDGLSLEVPRGCIYGFIGPNGSGKTTTLRMIMNIIHPDSGTIRVFGSERHEACTDRIGYLPEERGLYRKMKVRPLLRFYGEMKNGRDVRREVEENIRILGAGGGYILAPCHNIQAVSPPENVVTMYDTGYEYGWT